MKEGDKIPDLSESFDIVELLAKVDLRAFTNDSGDRFVEFTLRESRETLCSFNEVLQLYYRLKGDDTVGEVSNEDARQQFMVGSRFRTYSGEVQSIKLSDPNAAQSGKPQETQRYFKVVLREVESFYA